MYVIGELYFALTTHETNIRGNYYHQRFSIETDTGCNKPLPLGDIIDYLRKGIYLRTKKQLSIVNGFAISQVCCDDLHIPIKYYNFLEMDTECLGEDFYNVPEETKTELLVALSHHRQKISISSYNGNMSCELYL